MPLDLFTVFMFQYILYYYYIITTEVRACNVLTPSGMHYRIN